MKKKFIVPFLVTALVMAAGFSACGKKEDAPAPEQSAVSEETAEAAEETAETAESLPEEVEKTEAAETEATEVDATAYGYGGDDPVEAAVYKYMAEVVSQNYDEADVHIPTVNIVHVDYTSADEILVYGDFWIENYNIEGDTLECVSGGNYPGVIHESKDYAVTAFDTVADGEDFTASAEELFGEHYDNFMSVYSDSDARAELRKITVSDYVHFNNLTVTKYQDYGWDPVELY